MAAILCLLTGRAAASNPGPDTNADAALADLATLEA